MATYMGYERLFYYGTAGSQAATQVTRARDIKYTITATKGETTSGGAGSTPPIETHRVAALAAKITFQMILRSGDSVVTALVSAAAAGTPVALYLKAHTGGKGFDGDVVLTSCDKGKPYKGEQTLDFEAEPNDDNRTPNLDAS